jgi:hypothetical protein
VYDCIISNLDDVVEKFEDGSDDEATDGAEKEGHQEKKLQSAGQI